MCLAYRSSGAGRAGETAYLHAPALPLTTCHCQPPALAIALALARSTSTATQCDLYCTPAALATCVAEPGMRRLATVTLPLPEGWLKAVGRRTDYAVQVLGAQRRRRQGAAAGGGEERAAQLHSHTEVVAVRDDVVIGTCTLRLPPMHLHLPPLRLPAPAPALACTRTCVHPYLPARRWRCTSAPRRSRWR